MYFVKKHSDILNDWITISKQCDCRPILITLDHHTDTLPAFFKFGSMTTLLQSMEDAMANNERLNTTYLANDEHIDAAIRLGIIDQSFSIQLSDMFGTLSIEQTYFMQLSKIHRLLKKYPKPTPPFTYIQPLDDMFVVPFSNDWKEHQVLYFDDDGYNEKKHYDVALEDDYLTVQLSIIESMLKKSIWDTPFILDIDLDYFHTYASFNPQQDSVIRELLKKAIGVTVATEPDYFNSLCIEPINQFDIVRKILKIKDN